MGLQKPILPPIHYHRLIDILHPLHIPEPHERRQGRSQISIQARNDGDDSDVPVGSLADHEDWNTYEPVYRLTGLRLHSIPHPRAAGDDKGHLNPLYEHSQVFLQILRAEPLGEEVPQDLQTTSGQTDDVQSQRNCSNQSNCNRRTSRG